MVNFVICAFCKHFYRENFEGNFCDAFPDGDGIPLEIILGQNEHSKPLRGQENDVVFEPLDEWKGRL